MLASSVATSPGNFSMYVGSLLVGGFVLSVVDEVLDCLSSWLQATSEIPVARTIKMTASWLRGNVYFPEEHRRRSAAVAAGGTVAAGTQVDHGEQYKYPGGGELYHSLWPTRASNDQRGDENEGHASPPGRSIGEVRSQ